MKILVFGASGLVGKALKNAVSQNPAYVWLGRNDFDLAGDVWKQPLPDNIGTVIYLAQSQHSRNFPNQAADMLHVNTTAPLAILDRLHKKGTLQHFIYASTGNVNAHQSGTVPTFYTATKTATETLLDAWRDTINIATIRLHTIVGHDAPLQSMVPSLIEIVRWGGVVNLNGTHGDIFQPTHATDVAKALLSVVEQRWTGTASLAGPDQMTVHDMCEQIAIALLNKRRDQQKLPVIYQRLPKPAINYAATGAQLHDDLPCARATTTFREYLETLVDNFQPSSNSGVRKFVQEIAC